MGGRNVCGHEFVKAQKSTPFMNRRVSAKQWGDFREKESKGSTGHREKVPTFPCKDGYTEKDGCHRNLSRVATPFG